MELRDVVVVGASAGGVQALMELVEQLPADLDAPVLIVVHLPRYGVSVLPDILTRAGRLPAHHATDGEPLLPGHVYVAPPNRHLLIDGGAVLVSSGPLVNGHRPAIDPLFEGAAAQHGERVTGVILTGMLDDGVVGLRAVAAAGGTTVVQDPETALFDSMPRRALEHVRAHQVLGPGEIGSFLGRHLARRPAHPPAESIAVPSATGPGPIDAAGAVPDDEREVASDVDAGFACPRCSGSLREEQEGDLLRYRCRVGHVFGEDSLVAIQGEAVEDALWVAVRNLHERRALLRRMADQSRRRGHTGAAQRFEDRAASLEPHASTLQAVLDEFHREDLQSDASG